MSYLAVDAFLVPKDKVESVWERIFPWVEAALSYGCGENTPETIKSSLENGEKYLWVAVGADGVIYGMAIVRIVSYPLYRSALIVLCGGEDGKKWFHLLGDRIEPWAASLGCKEMRLYGRRGWARALAAQGWKYTMTVVSKTVGDGKNVR